MSAGPLVAAHWQLRGEEFVNPHFGREAKGYRASPWRAARKIYDRIAAGFQT